MVVGGIYGWALEPSVDPDAGHHDGDHDDDGSAPDPALAGVGAEEQA